MGELNIAQDTKEVPDEPSTLAKQFERLKKLEAKINEIKQRRMEFHLFIKENVAKTQRMKWAGDSRWDGEND